MEFLVAAIVGFFVWRWYKKLKRVQFIQATEYLSQLEGGASVDEANGAALKLFSEGSHPLDNAVAERNALMFAAHNTLGKQNPVILVAKQHGFLG